jgi:integrase
MRCDLGCSPTAEISLNIVFGKVGAMSPPSKVPNAERRSREHLTAVEIDRLIAAAHRLGRHGHRDATMILLAYRHGLRVSELVSLRREQLDLRQGRLHVRRRKNGLPSTYPLRGPELRSLREVLREYPDNGASCRIPDAESVKEQPIHIGSHYCMCSCINLICCSVF